MKPTIESHPDAPEGTLLRLGRYAATDFLLGSVVLCRNTAPLVAHAYGLLQRDVPCRILGRDLGKALANIVTKMRAQTLEEFIDRLTLWENREVDKAHKENRNPGRVYDQSQCLRFFVDSLDEDSQTVDSLLAKIDLLFTDDRNGGFSRVTLSTIHKAKGGEWDRVFILDVGLIPSRFATQEWQFVQERNLLYVAVTRSKHTLIYIMSDRWREEQ